MEETTATSAVPEGLGSWAVDLLGRLIQTNTVNPPGNEGAGPGVPARLADAAGFECELLEAEPGRPNLVARLHGASRWADAHLPRPRRHRPGRSR